jgi:hypothetical protein
MAYTEEQAGKAREYANRVGVKAGSNAADAYATERFVNLSQGELVFILQALADGDAEVWDTLPMPDLSGQWADSLTDLQLVTDALEVAGIDDDKDAEELHAEICTAYDGAFLDTVADLITLYARRAAGLVEDEEE